MNDLRKAAEMALVALEEINYRIERDLEHDHEWAVVERELGNEAITALRQALDKPEIDPQALVEMAVLAEREACAKVCETFYNHEAKDCAEAIRARGEK